jgi:tRNA-modifying protein YgfZ
VTDALGDAWALRHEVGAIEVPRDVVLASGPDTVAFLQGQLSQDLAAVADGQSVESLVLQPAGKVDAMVRATRRSAEDWLLDVDGGFGAALVARLSRFKLRTRCDLEPLDGWRCVAVRGAPGSAVDLSGTVAEVVAPVEWPGLWGVDLLGPDVTVPPGVRHCTSTDAYEALRIEAGVPRMGAELDDRTIPAEAGVVPRTVSFTKGCFVGQELVARIDSRGGNVPRHLRGLVIGTNVLPPVGASVVVGGKAVGAVTSVAESAERRAPVALAYVGRAVTPPAAATVAWDGGEVPATVEALPLVG